MSKRILLVDDDPLLRRSLAFNLGQAGYSVQTAASAEDGLAMAAQNQPDLVLLDIGLPGMDGLDALRRFREMGLPVIFVTARRRELDEVLGLELGADDYVTKPFRLDIVLARIKAVLRRAAEAQEAEHREFTPLTVGDLVIDQAAHTVTLAQRPIDLTPREFDLLVALAMEAGHVLSVSELLARVWGAEFEGEPQVVYVHIRWLREKLEVDPANPQRIVTVRGLGYKLVSQED